MVSLAVRFKKTAASYGLSAFVLVLGLALSAYFYQDRLERSKAEHLSELQEGAKSYENLLRHRLDLYLNASQLLAAFFSASNDIEPEEFNNFIKGSRIFERLEGMGSFGYLPKVSAKQAGRFEAEARRSFPGYHILNRRHGADAWFPLLYGQYRAGMSRADQLRGIDFSAIPDRWTAMKEAQVRDEPVATRLLGALHDSNKRRIVQIYSPVWKLKSAAGKADLSGDLGGFVFSTLYVDRLFLNFDNGRLAQRFDLEVFDDTASPGHIVFDADKAPHALAAETDHLLAHRAEVQFANRKWLIYFYARKADLEPRSTHGALVFAIGLLLSLIASYAAAAWPRYLSRKRAMRDFSERFAGFFQKHPFAVYALDRQGRFIQVNQQMAKELGVSCEALIGTTTAGFIADDKRAAAAQRFQEVLAGNAVACITQVTSSDGRSSDLSIVMIPMSAGDKVTHVLGFAENITDRKRTEAALYESRQMLRLILDNIPQNVFWKDTDSVYEGGNRSLLAEAGLQSVDELIGKTDADLRWKDQAEHFRNLDLEVMTSGLARLRMQAADVRRDGTDCWIETSKIPLKDDKGEVVGVLSVTEDITARKYMEQELFRRANFDTLTGLPNRGYFQNQLDEALKRAQRRDGLAVMYFDIDRFKQINDTYGHDAGDKIIRMFAERIRSVLRESDFMARIGGDEFVLIAEALSDRNDAAVIARKLVEAMEPVFDIGGTNLQVSTSIGVAYFEAGMTADQLLKAADEAMYAAKRAGRNCFRQAGRVSERGLLAAEGKAG
jgi:diguanylate cyclase (GGDEF)-like protein/PAS domain S-box-containing protein